MKTRDKAPQLAQRVHDTLALMGMEALRASLGLAPASSLADKDFDQMIAVISDPERTRAAWLRLRLRLYSREV